MEYGGKVWEGGRLGVMGKAGLIVGKGKRVKEK